MSSVLFGVMLETHAKIFPALMKGILVISPKGCQSLKPGISPSESSSPMTMNAPSYVEESFKFLSFNELVSAAPELYSYHLRDYFK